jgi:hypothetical protein
MDIETIKQFQIDLRTMQLLGTHIPIGSQDGHNEEQRH